MLFKRLFQRRKRTSDNAEASIQPKAPGRLQDKGLRRSASEQHADSVTPASEVEALSQALKQAPDESARETLSERLVAALCKEIAPEPSAEAFQDMLAAVQAPQALEQVARQAPSPRARGAAIARILNPKVLADCAVEDRLAANRSLAVERLTAKEPLEDVQHRIGKRDKTVYRIAREKLRLIAEQEERPRLIRAQCEDILAKLERLGRLGNWSQDRALLDHLQRQWTEIADDVDPEWLARLAAERDRFLHAYDEHCRENSAQIAEQTAMEAAREQAEALLDELQALVDHGESETIEVERIAAAWEKLPGHASKEGSALHKRYDRCMQALSASRQARADQQQQGERLAKLLATLERLSADSRTLDYKRATSVLQEGRTLAIALPDQAQASAFIGLADRLESRLQRQHKQAEQKLKDFPKRLQELEAHLAAGELKKADPIYQSLQAALELMHTSGIRKSEETKLSSQLRALAPRLRELQNWRRWGADQHREALCADMEALIEKDSPLEALAETLRALQANWKNLDKTGSPASQALWDRFHQASETVYARCRPYMESQAAEREANRAAREQVCEQLEAFLSKVDWERVDWKKIMRAEREMRQTWASIGQTEGRHRKQLERRFYQSLHQLDQRLDAERKRNQTHKRGLVERVQALVDLPDLDAAIEQTKAIQREWHTTVPARQKDENKLWQRFRAACDAVFERRAALQQAHVSGLQQNLEAREALCREAIELASRTQDPKQLAVAQRELAERWRAAESLPVPRQAAGKLAQSWQKSCAELEARRRNAEEQARAASFDLLKQQAQLCERIEQMLLNDASDLTPTAAIEEAWSQLPTQEDEGLQQAIAQRFQQALSAAEAPSKGAALKERLDANAERRGHLCLQLEIIAGIESPTELAQQRLEFQVARLAERMAEGEDDPLQGATSLLHEWYLCGPARLDEALKDRFTRVSDALTQRPTATAEPA
ncbi:DUF349 domain-containing protein [Thiorhodococcus mannitoliphagus]|uniref:DUF349 domain-containing protein n=1 Tax=Thiorhodococcus mannitoliphagus TaxID=329406 RepID=A0A6P1E145_9GAMM|nr:DUF349 domain-containing protein [Thiorhodococcus mannitoliphagus]NEX22766.1 DUF349 domain-containing protein [Thiorhodococcus mannitoliphagus]